MLRQNHRNALMLACLSTMMPGAIAMGQIFTRTAPEVVMEEVPATGNACGMRPCPPRALTYGYYHEHWRRWPEELQPGATPSLTPYATPPADAPKAETPDPRDEGSVAPRRRQSEWAPAETPAVPAPRGLAPSRQPTEDRPAPAQTPADDFPMAPAEEPAPRGNGGIFPSEDDSPGSALPDVAPSDSSDLPTLEPDAGAPSPGGGVEDIFDLDDFGQTEDPRLKRYQSHLRGQLRRAVPVVAQRDQKLPKTERLETQRPEPLPSRRVATVASAGRAPQPQPQPQPSAPVQLATHEATAVEEVGGRGRRNPLRARFLSTGRGAAPAVPAEPMPMPQTEPIQESDESSTLPLEPIQDFSSSLTRPMTGDAASNDAGDEWATNQLTQPAQEHSASGNADATFEVPSEAPPAVAATRPLRSSGRNNPLRR
jgi:hypothetical protein